MIPLLLLACAEPSTLGTVSEALAARAVADGELPLRMATATAGLLAETCGVETVEEHVFVSRSAAALGASVATVERDDTTQTWTFADIGLDDTSGTLVVETDASQDNLALTYTGDGLKFTAGMEVRDCDTDVPSVVIGGTGTWTTADVTVGLTLVGQAPANGLVFDPVTADRPGGGQLRAEDEAAGWVILLDELGTVDASLGAWTGTASGTGWTADVAVGWP